MRSRALVRPWRERLSYVRHVIFRPAAPFQSYLKIVISEGSFSNSTRNFNVFSAQCNETRREKGYPRKPSYPSFSCPG